MKNMNVTIGLLLSLVMFSSGAMADDVPEPMSYKVISIEDKASAKEIKIVVKDLKNGVFILAAGGWSGKYPNTTKLIREMMVAKGIKVTEDAATADIGLQFSNFIGFSLDDVETRSNTIDGGAIALKSVLFLAGGFATLGGNSSQAVMLAVTADPSVKVTGRNKIDGENIQSVFSTIKYETNKKGAEVSQATFYAYIDDFINKHFVFESPVESPVMGASGIPVAAVLSEIK